MRQTSIPLLVLLPTLLYGYPSQAGPSACNDFIPSGHVSGQSPPDSQAFPSIFSMTADSSMYTPGKEIKVTLKSVIEGRNFKGFLVQARPADPTLTFADGSQGIGQFINFQAGTKELCSRANGMYAVTHTNRTEKDSVVVTWKAPSAAAGHVVFVATFVEAYSTFWAKQKSSIVRDASVSDPLPYPDEPSPVQEPVSAGSLIPKPVGCGSSMGCFHDCNSNGCNYIVTWSNHEDHVMFTLKVKFAGLSSGFVALGLSEDRTMGSDGVTECVFLNNAVTVHNSQNTGTSNRRLTSPVAKEGTGSYTDGTFSCSFELPKAASVPLLDVVKDRYLLLARGTSVSESGLSKHTVAPIISQRVADFQKNEEIAGSAPSLNFVKIHGSLMVAAWIFAASIGIVIARYYKPQWPENTCCGEKVWFQMHRGFMILVFLAAATAFILIFVQVQGYSDLGEEASKKAHPILGIIVTALMVINPIMALFRPHPGDANRPIFNWAHFGVGSAAHILAVATVFLGVNLGKPAIPSYVTWILVGYVAWQILIECLLIFLRCQTEAKDRRESYELSQKGQITNIHRGTRIASSPVRQFLLLVHVVAVTSLATAIVVCIIIS